MWVPNRSCSKTNVIRNLLEIHVHSNYANELAFRTDIVLWKWKLYDFAFKERLVGDILKQNNDSDLVFRTIFLKWVSS